jgi:hypothetical protein
MLLACDARPMHILAAIHAPEAIHAIMNCLGIPTRAPTIAPAESEDDPAAFVSDSWPDPLC